MIIPKAVTIPALVRHKMVLISPKLSSRRTTNEPDRDEDQQCRFDDGDNREHLGLVTILFVSAGIRALNE